MGGITKYSHQEKSKWIKLWLTSGTSRMAFSKQQGLNYNNFKNWVYQYEQKIKSGTLPEALPNQATPATNFIAIKIEAPSPSIDQAGMIQITYSNGNRLTIHQQVSAAYLRELLS
jgi:transposase-like protein